MSLPLALEDPALAGARPLGGPERVGSELRCRVRLADGREALLAWLAPELAREPAMRRRYVRDLARLREREVPGLAPILAVGPAEPHAAGAPPPWRLRLDPPGETLEAWLKRRAPAPVDECAELGIAICGLLAGQHARGVVLRDLHPRLIVRGPKDALWLTDVGLARVDILSTRTAASLLLEGSPYAAPEQYARTSLDPRADLYAVGVILYRALTGLMPRGEGPVFLAEGPLVPPRELRAEVPPELDAIVRRCLELDPTGRHASARELAAALAGEGEAGGGLARTTCQHCGARLRVGQRLCLTCGREAVQFEATPGGTCSVDLTAAREDAGYLATLASELGALSAGEVPALNLVIGDSRMYSKAELAVRHKLPLRLFDGLSRATAERLQGRLRRAGLTTAVVDRSPAALRRATRRAAGWTAAATLAVAMIPVFVGAPWWVALAIGLVGLIVGVSIVFGLRGKFTRQQAPLLALRPAPAALPASDPLVARLAALLQGEVAPELRELCGGLALALQRLVDHAAAAPGARGEIGLIKDSLGPLVALVERQVRRVSEIDAVLRELEEGTLVRALAASEARGEPPSRREDLLAGLDRLRALEDERALAMHRLLSAEHLLREAVELGLEVRDEEALYQREVNLALRALRGEP